jgi:signal transduction histidine kinase
VVLKTKLSSEVARVKVDPQRIKQVLFNLFENAYEAMPGGGTLTVGTKNQDDYMVLEIEDTGYGIPEEEMKNLFTPFYSTKASGAGLGLPVSKKIITDHNGFIQVESKINQGTKFSIYLPLNPSSIKQGGDEDV